MRNNFHSLLLVILILVSLVITKEARITVSTVSQPASFLESVTATILTPTKEPPETANLSLTIPYVYLPEKEVPPNLSLISAITETYETQKIQLPSINFQAKAILVSNLDDDKDLINFNIYKRWPLASIAKLMTAVLAAETIGRDKEILISEKAVATEGDSGKLKVGELYKIDDLIKIMLVTSSNDAAAALAEFYVFGQGNFVKLMNKKAVELEMNQTVFFDSSGLSPLNQSTANDIRKLMKYTEETYPEILAVTQPPDFQGLKNINPFAGQVNFLGGKTGFIEEARENIVSLFFINNQRILIVVLGAENRYQQTQALLSYLISLSNL
jgi:D-alanyl-D-alanine carboxypeptidase